MRKTLIASAVLGSLIVVGSVAAAPAQAQPPVEVAAVAGQVVPGEYIVTTRPGTAKQVSAHRAGAATMHVYDGVIHGFAARLTPDQLLELQQDPDVLAIEPNQVVHAQDIGIDAVQTPTPNWGLDRIDQRNLPLNNSFTYFNSGLGVTTYVIDTGIEVSHPQFGGRAAVAYDAIGGNGLDCNGHGTHLAGIVGSNLYGVAKRVALRSVRGVRWHRPRGLARAIRGEGRGWGQSPRPPRRPPALGGTVRTAVDFAVDNLAASGVFVVASGGSSGTDACNFSPGGAPGAYTAIRTTQTDQSPTSNNWGTCVDIQSPGTLITSTWLGGATMTLSGTAMAAAHVAGVAALFKDAVNDVPSPLVAAFLTGVATSGVLTGVHPMAPNLLLYTNVI